MTYGLFVKRIFDLICSTVLLILLLPLFVIIAVLIKLDSKGPVFFFQERAGKGGQPFTIWKFRTMCQNAVSMGEGFFTNENDARITRVGNFLRKWSLDELPQLINIFKGEMSIIGPRPTLMYQVEQYDNYQRQRLQMPPGVTGWAQVNGRNSLSWPERIELDIWYVNNWNLTVDFKIILKTIKVVKSREGIYADKEKFKLKQNDTLGS